MLELQGVVQVYFGLFGQWMVLGYCYYQVVGVEMQDLQVGGCYWFGDDVEVGGVVQYVVDNVVVEVFLQVDGDFGMSGEEVGEDFWKEFGDCGGIGEDVDMFGGVVVVFGEFVFQVFYLVYDQLCVLQQMLVCWGQFDVVVVVVQQVVVKLVFECFDLCVGGGWGKEGVVCVLGQVG